jgi:hypothetical protein
MRWKGGASRDAGNMSIVDDTADRKFSSNRNGASERLSSMSQVMFLGVPNALLL